MTVYGKDINEIPPISDAYGLTHPLLDRTNVLSVLSRIIIDADNKCTDRLKAIELYCKLTEDDYCHDYDDDVNIDIDYGDDN